ncbi:hypothetical protein WLX36_25320, partial [Bordetella bronchiseptica]
MRIRVYATLAVLAIAAAGLLAYRQFAPPPEPAAPVEPPLSAERPQPPAPPVLPDPHPHPRAHRPGGRIGADQR